MKKVGMTAVCIALISSGAFGSQTPAEQRRAASEAAEFSKLEPTLDFLRARNARDYAIRTPNGIDEATFVEIGGIRQWVTIRGEDQNNPVLLFLHGGPGDATNPWGYAAFRSWLKDFTVVQWDQRGAGRTFGQNRSSVSTITPERMVQDGIELSEWLLKKLHKKKIVLVGHSWGSVLGVFMAEARPDLFYAFVGTGQVAADPARTAAVAYAALLERARRDGNAQALHELKEIGPPPFKDGGFAVEHRWAMRFGHADVFLASTLGFALDAPGSSIADINDWFDGQIASGDRLAPHFDVLDRELLKTQLAIPVFVIQGADDFTTPASLARAYIRSLHAPRKAFVTIPGAGHFAVFTKPDAFLKELKARVLPLTR